MSFVRLACAAAALAVSVPALAQYAKPEDAVKNRKAAYTIMGTQMGRINAQLKAPTPNVPAIQAATGVLAAVDHLPFDGFGPGTDMVADTRAKPEIWQQQAKFKELGDKMVAEVDKLNAAARSGDVKAIQAAFGETGKSCKACHDQFRKD